MRKTAIGAFLLAGMLVLLPQAVFATNGDNLIGIGPISRSMGGVGLAAPQDAISAIFANPAATCFGNYCPNSEVIFGGTAFDATVDSTLDFSAIGMGVESAKSRTKSFAIPAIAVTYPLTKKLRLGVGAYGVSGMGVDYRDRGMLYRDPYTMQDLDVNLGIMKFAVNLGYLVNNNFSIGGALSIDYASLDMGHGTSADYTMGLKLGALYHHGPFNFGVCYTTPQKVTHQLVANFDAAFGSTTMDDLDLESPQSASFGVAFEPNKKFLVETDVKWYNWADADGYKDFDWDNQWVMAIGVQYKPTPALALRAGFNHGDSPVNVHNGFNLMGVTDVQGTKVPTLNYEVLRIVGFPAIVEDHATVGVGYSFSRKLGMNFSYVHAFKETISESSIYNLVKLESSNYEDSLSFDLVWHF